MYDSHMINRITWNSYVDQISDGMKDSQIAAAIDVAPSTISRWRSGQAPNPGHVAALCDYFGENPIVGFVAAGYLSRQQMDEIFNSSGISLSTSLEDFSSTALANELARRAKEWEKNDGMGS